MCRIIGLISKKSIDEDTVINMRDSLSHGGPDAANLYFNENKTVALGHRRLAILDLSEAGNQPMHWKNWVICYNGEIYNFKEVKQRLSDYKFSTGTDTEVIIKALDKWGLDAVHHFRGMFVFALYNKTTKKLLLCRDRIGVKPLYWYQKNDLFMFASELKAFHQYPAFDKTIDKKAVGLFLQQGYIHAPYCIFKYAHKLEPGHFLEVDENQVIKKTCYWDIERINQSLPISKKTENLLEEELEQLLKESFQLRMVADVPVGMFLSGGIDSSLVTAILQRQSNRQLKTFTIGFETPERNEAPFAREVAQHIGTEHNELICTERDFEKIIPKLPAFYDEPFGDSSALPTYLVSQLAREQVTVSLSADGGDELFGGYTKYEITKSYYSKIHRLPRVVKRVLTGLTGAIDTEWLAYNKEKIPFLNGYTDVSNKVYKFQNAIKANSVGDFFNIASSFLTDKQLSEYLSHHYLRFDSKELTVSENGLLSFLGMIDIKTYLEGDIMCKVDRATMQVALEGREPFLDHHLIEFSQQIPDNFKIKGNASKYLLRKILHKYVPKELIERPKQGFAIPLNKWLRTLLKPNLLVIKNDSSFYDFFGLNRRKIESDIDNFLSKSKYVNPNFIWFIYILYSWQKEWL